MVLYLPDKLMLMLKKISTNIIKANFDGAEHRITGTADVKKDPDIENDGQVSSPNTSVLPSVCL